MIIKKLVTTICLLIICFIGKAQQKDDFHVGFNYFKDPLLRGKFDFILGYQRLNNNTLELGLASGHRGYEGYGIVYGNYHLITEHNLGANKYIIGTKIGYKLSILFFDLTSQVIYYTDFKESNIAFRPEIGISYFGFIDINYGYNYMPSSENLKQMRGHLIALRLTIGKGVKF